MMKKPLEEDFPKPIEDLTVDQRGTTTGPSSEIATHRHRQGTPSDCMICSVLVTIFCCPMIGVAAIFASLKVRGLLSDGDLSGAWRASDFTKFLVIAGALVGLAFWIFALFFSVPKVTSTG